MEMVPVYQRIARLLAGTSGSSWTNPCSQRATRVPRHTSWRESDSTSLGNCSVTCTVEWCFLLFRWSLQYSSLCPEPFDLTLGTTKEPGSILFAPSLQGEGKIPPKPPLPHGKQQQLSHSFLIGDALQPLQHRALWPFAGLPQICPSLSCTGGLRIGARSLDTASPVLSGEKDHLHPHAGSTLPNVPKNTIGLLCSKETFLALVWLSAHQDPHVLSCQTASQLGAPNTSWCLGCSSRGAGLCTYWTTRVLFSSLLSSLWMAAWPSGIPAASRVSCHAPYVHTRVCWAIHPQLKSKPLQHSW